MADEYYYGRRGQKHGPVGPSELKRLAAIGDLQQDDLIWKEGLPNWVPAGSLKGLFSGPPPLPASSLPIQQPPLPSGTPQDSIPDQELSLDRGKLVAYFVLLVTNIAFVSLSLPAVFLCSGVFSSIFDFVYPSGMDFDKNPLSGFAWLLLAVILGGAGLGLAIIGAIGLPTMIVSYLTRRLAKAAVSRFRYRVSDNVLIVEASLFWTIVRQIPFRHITDCTVVQGPLMKAAGIWQLSVQTAGSGGTKPECKLIGLTDPESVRRLLLSYRK